MFIYRAARDLATSETRFLDVGSKTGENLAGIPGEVISLDIEFQKASSPVSYVLADGCQMPFSDDSFDVVVSNQVLEHISQQDRHLMISEISRVLKPEGRLLLSTPNRFFPFGGVPHTLPLFYPMLPRKVGLLFGQFILTERQYDYYRDSFFPISSRDVRRIVQDYFNKTEYITIELGGEYGEDIWPGWFVRLFDAVEPLMKYKPFKQVFEAVFSYTAYRCRYPIK